MNTPENTKKTVKDYVWLIGILADLEDEKKIVQQEYWNLVGSLIEIEE